MADTFSIDHRSFKSVAAYASETADMVIASGSNVQLYEAGASAVFDQNCYCKIIWDPSGVNEIILATHGDIVQTLRKNILGDGVKILRIELINNTSQDQFIGGYVLGGFQ